MASELSLIYNNIQRCRTANDVLKFLQEMESDSRSRFLVSCNKPMTAIKEFGSAESVLDVLPKLFRALIDLYHQSPELFDDHDTQGVTLSDIEETDLASYTLKSNADILDANSEVAAQIVARASEYLDDMDKLITIVKEVRTEKLAMPDVHKALAVNVIDYDDANIATLAAFDKLILNFVFARVEVSSSRNLDKGFVLRIPEYLENVFVVLSLAYRKGLKQVGPNKPGLFYCHMSKFRVLADPSSFHEFKMIWMDRRYVEDPSFYARMADS